MCTKRSRKGEQSSEGRGGSPPIGSLELCMPTALQPTDIEAVMWPMCLCVFIVHACLCVFYHAAKLAQILLLELPMTDVTDKCALQFVWHFKG